MWGMSHQLHRHKYSFNVDNNRNKKRWKTGRENILNNTSYYALG